MNSIPGLNSSGLRRPNAYLRRDGPWSCFVALDDGAYTELQLERADVQTYVKHSPCNSISLLRGSGQ
jgi:hypothetical protein